MQELFNKRKNTFWVFFRLFRVAGPGFEPGSSGYEPDEIPLLYPAMCLSDRSSLYQII